MDDEDNEVADIDYARLEDELGAINGKEEDIAPTTTTLTNSKECLCASL
jgi:hypothetical protein